MRAHPGDSEAGVVAASVYAGGRRVKDIAIEEAGEWSKRPGHVVWIGLWEPNADLLQRVQAQLGLHYLAIEDAGKAHQHPKIEQYGEALFVVARTTQLIDGRIAFGETHLFVGAATWCRSATALRAPTPSSASAASPAPLSSPKGKTTFSMPSSISSSTITCRYWKRFTRKWKRSRTAYSPNPPSMWTWSGFT